MWKPLSISNQNVKVGDWIRVGTFGREVVEVIETDVAVFDYHPIKKELTLVAIAPDPRNPIIGIPHMSHAQAGEACWVELVSPVILDRGERMVPRTWEIISTS